MALLVAAVMLKGLKRPKPDFRRTGLLRNSANDQMLDLPGKSIKDAQECLCFCDSRCEKLCTFAAHSS